MGGSDEWAVGGGLYISIGLFEADIVLVLGPDKPRGPKRHLTNAGVNIRPIPPI